MGPEVLIGQQQDRRAAVFCSSPNSELEKSSDASQSWLSQGYRALTEGKWSRACFAVSAALLVHDGEPSLSHFALASIAAYFLGNFREGTQASSKTACESSPSVHIMFWQNLCTRAGGLGCCHKTV